MWWGAEDESRGLSSGCKLLDCSLHCYGWWIVAAQRLFLSTITTGVLSATGFCFQFHCSLRSFWIKFIRVTKCCLFSFQKSRKSGCFQCTSSYPFSLLPKTLITDGQFNGIPKTQNTLPTKCQRVLSVTLPLHTTDSARLLMVPLSGFSRMRADDCRSAYRFETEMISTEDREFFFAYQPSIGTR